MQETPSDDPHATRDLDAALTAARIEADFGDRVRGARRLAGMTQRQLADAVGLDASAISRLEQGSRAIRLGEAAAIADALKVPLPELLSINDEPMPALESARTNLERAASQLRDATNVAVDTIDHVRSVLDRPDVREAVAISSVDVDRVIAICDSAFESFANYDHTYVMRKISSELVEMDQPHMTFGTGDDAKA